MTIIEAGNIAAGYSDKEPVVRHIDLSVNAGEVVALLGPNGAGKTTTLKALSGVLPLQEGEVRWKGAPSVEPLHARCRDGLSFVTEERCIFFQLTTRQNLKVAGVSTGEAIELFPALEARMNVKAGQMSGGEQQMLALARALGRHPEVLFIDELSIGLAPIVVKRLLQAVREAADRGVGVLLVEQFVEGALEIADRAYVLRNGEIAMSGTADEMRRKTDAMQDAYLGEAGSR